MRSHTNFVYNNGGGDNNNDNNNNIIIIVYTRCWFGDDGNSLHSGGTCARPNDGRHRWTRFKGPSPPSTAPAHPSVVSEGWKLFYEWFLWSLAIISLTHHVAGWGGGIDGTILWECDTTGPSWTKILGPSKNIWNSDADLRRTPPSGNTVENRLLEEQIGRLEISLLVNWSTNDNEKRWL